MGDDVEGIATPRNEPRKPIWGDILRGRSLGIPEQVCREANLGYLDPATVDVGAFEADPGTLVVPNAGEVLFRLR